MNRREFLWSVGAAGTASAAATGVATRELERKARADGLQKAATTNAAPSRLTTNNAEKPSAPGVILGYLEGSAGMLANPAAEHRAREATGLPWLKWDRAAAAASAASLFKRSTTVNLSIGVLQRAPPTYASTLQALEITAHFAIDEAPYFAPFGAWSYRAESRGARKALTQPLTFTAEVPDRVALEVSYGLDATTIAGGTPNSGGLYLPVGRDSATGLTTGLFVLAAASPVTGTAPDLSVLVFSGDIHTPLVGARGDRPDFDYLVLAIRPIAI